MDDEPIIFVDDDPPVVRRRGPKLGGRAAGPPPQPLRPPRRLNPGPNFLIDTWPANTMRIRFRTHILTAAATPVNNVHSHVLRLHLQDSFLQSVLRKGLGYLPCAVQSWFGLLFPEWTLPSRLVLKKQKKNLEEEFEAEKAAYAKLRPLQGIVIPRLFGELKYDNTPALLMSDIGGVCLAAPEGGMLELDEFRRLVRQALTALSRFGVLHDDTKLDNFHLVDGRVMVVDLEMTSNENEQPLTDEQLEFCIDCNVDSLPKFYEENQYCFWKTGFSLLLVMLSELYGVTEGRLDDPSVLYI